MPLRRLTIQPRGSNRAGPGVTAAAAAGVEAEAEAEAEAEEAGGGTKEAAPGHRLRLRGRGVERARKTTAAVTGVIPRRRGRGAPPMEQDE